MNELGKPMVKLTGVYSKPTLTDHYFEQSGYRSSTIALFCEDLEM